MLIGLGWSRPQAAVVTSSVLLQLAPGANQPWCRPCDQKKRYRDYRPSHCNWLVDRDRNAADLCPVETQSVVHSGVRQGLRLGSAYRFLQGARPFGIIEALWACVAFRRYRHTRRWLDSRLRGRLSTLSGQMHRNFAPTNPPIQRAL